MESLIWVGCPSLGRLLATKRIELESPKAEDNFKAFPMVIQFLIYRFFCCIKLGDPNYGTRPKSALIIAARPRSHKHSVRKYSPTLNHQRGTVESAAAGSARADTPVVACATVAAVERTAARIAAVSRDRTGETAAFVASWGRGT